MEINQIQSEQTLSTENAKEMKLKETLQLQNSKI